MPNAPLVQELHGKYYTQTKGGQFYIGSTASAGVVPPVCTATAQTFGLWNPLGNQNAAIITKLTVGLVTVGTVTSSFCWSVITNAPAQLATGAAITAFTAVAPQNGIVGGIGQTQTNTVKFANSAATTTASVYLRPINISAFMAATPAAANMFWSGMSEDYDGSFILMPGAAVFVANNIAGVATYDISCSWYEVPVPL